MNREIQARIQNEERTFVTSTLALCDASGVINGVLAITRDTTDSRRAQHEREELLRKLQDTQKLESLGLLAGGIAHDFNNLLTAVLGNASLARMDVADGSPVADCLGQIEEAALRAADLCKQMLAYSGKGRFVITDFDVTQLVQETTELLRHSISKKAQLSLQITPGLPAVTGDATQIRQILMNLVINASEAIGDRPGVIGVKTGAMHINATTLAGAAFESEIQHGAGVYIEVSDDGCGMTAETRARIFDPFFTTKFTGRGLGLAAVLGIARSHQGVLLVDSEVGRGSRFRLVLPVSALHALPTPTTQENLLAGWQGSGSVLVVDDEAQIRILAARVLGSRGFKVDVAADGREGIEKLRKSPLGYRAVLLDLTMPGLDGVQTFRLLRECSPGVRVLLMSGYSEHEASGRFGAGGPGGFLQKPFRPEDLLRHLRQLLEAA